MPRLTLVGYRGTGKSTVAALVSNQLGCGWCDADVILEERLGVSIADLVRTRGEAAFRDAEAIVLAELVAGCAGVLATGGGVVLRPENRLLLRRAGRPVAWLVAPADVVRGRLAADPATAQRRPALSGRDPLDEVADAIASRGPLYREVSDTMIDATDDPAAIAGRIVAWLPTFDGGGSS